MPTNSLTINLTTLTPIWTGGVEGKADRLHITGLMGSLRSGYEMIVRGLGAKACDPTKHECIYDSEKSNPLQDVCDVCRVFGATGWARRFRLMVADETQLRPGSREGKIIASRKYIDRSGKEKQLRGWFFNNPPRVGSASIEIIATAKQFEIKIIGGLIQFLADWTSIGARPQMGFGVISTIPHQDTQSLLHYLQAIVESRSYSDLPSLQNSFFASISANKFPKNETFNLKYDLRRLFAANADLRHFVMGTVQEERQGAKIMMSRPYNNDTTIRVWGWIPEEVAKFRTPRDQVIKQIHTHLSTHYTLDYWREFDSPRDKHRYNNALKFLESLLKGEK